MVCSAARLTSAVQAGETFKAVDDYCHQKISSELCHVKKLHQSWGRFLRKSQICLQLYSWNSCELLIRSTMFPISAVWLFGAIFAIIEFSNRFLFMSLGAAYLLLYIWSLICHEVVPYTRGCKPTVSSWRWWVGKRIKWTNTRIWVILTKDKLWCADDMMRASIKQQVCGMLVLDSWIKIYLWIL